MQDSGFGCSGVEFRASGLGFLLGVLVKGLGFRAFKV